MDGDGHGLSLVTLLVASVALAGYLLFEPLPQSGRPTVQDTPNHLNAHSQDIPARLWQDPFEVISRYLSKASSDRGTKRISAHNITECTRFDYLLADLKRRNQLGDLLVVPVVVSGGNYPEAEENRRRIRYAVVSGLIRSSYSPEQPGHIGLVVAPGPAGSPANSSHPRFRHQKVYPYEWYQQLDADGTAKRSLLVVWVNEDLLGRQPITTFANWQTRLRTALAGPSPPMRIIGTFGSGTLSSIATELPGWSDPQQFPLEAAAGADSLVILSPTATISEALLPNSTDTADSLAHRWSKTLPNSQLIRITNTDAVLMQAISTELQQRGVTSECDKNSLKCAHIAVISESDTAYGRHLPTSFVANSPFGTSRIHSFSYLRGLDGRIPGDDTPAVSPTKKEKVESKAAQTSFGEARIDYLERMAERLETLDDELKLQLKGRLRAIGVLGTDVYDKLLILQALRHRFPGTIFFTTDLDARLLDPGNFSWTRNMVVASDFGLQLRNALQGGIPPFRNSYQTATYLATLLAAQTPIEAGPLQLDLSEALSPRLFEIGRGHAFDLSPATTESPLDLLTIGNDTLTEPAYLHPPQDIPNQADFRTRQWILLGLTLALMLIIALMVIDPIQRAATSIKELHNDNTKRTNAFAAILLGYLAVALLAAIFSKELGEPFSWTGGVSAWPAEIIRISGGVLSVLLLWRTLVEFELTNKEINREYFAFKWSSDCSQCKHTMDGAAQVLGTGLTRLCQLFCFSSIRGSSAPGAQQHVSAKQQWSLYLYRGQPRFRWIRVLLSTALFMAVGYITINLLSGPPPVPVRSAAMAGLDKLIILGMSVLPFLLLLFTVIDSSRNSIALMDALNQPLTEWPETVSGLRWRMLNEHGFHAEDLDEWLDVFLSADLTERLGNIVYFPFLIIFMLLLSRLTWFDNWTMPAGLIAIIAISAAYAIYCSANLQFAARRIKKNAREHLQQRRAQVLAGNSASGSNYDLNNHLAQIDTLIDDLDQLKRGAFRPWHQQPVIKAFLLLMSSASIFTLDMLGGS